MLVIDPVAVEQSANPVKEIGFDDSFMLCGIGFLAVGAMDDAQTLIDQLTTLAGMIMEDASAVAVAVGSGVDQSAKLKDC